MLCSPTKKSIFLEKFIEPGTGFFFHWHLRMRVIQFMSHRTTTIFFHNILHVTGQTLFVDCIVLWLTLRLWIRHNATGSLQHLDWRSSICYRSKETRRHCRLVESGGRTTGLGDCAHEQPEGRGWASYIWSSDLKENGSSGVHQVQVYTASQPLDRRSSDTSLILLA